ncbi:MAG: hypothetical protein JWL70_850 [Acidimicrobiia bacterium]|nr:hypothetical protein [Acidimicrobiia bacterium]
MAPLLEAAERPTTPAELLRSVVPEQPVLLVGALASWESRGVIAWLEATGWAWTSAVDADRARWLASIQPVSMVLVNGDKATVWSVVEATRPVTMAPIVVLATPAEGEVVLLVGAGVDAIIDPANGVDELFARVVALLRRSDQGWGPGVRYLKADGLVVDLWTQECDLDGCRLHLSPTEYSLLTFLMTHPQQALASHTIVRRVWGWLPSDGKNTLRIFVNRLRGKLDDDPRAPRYIASVRGTGYRFIRNVSEMGAETAVGADRVDVAPLLMSVEAVAVGLQHCHTVELAQECLLDALEATGYADAMALFRVSGDRMELASARHMSDAWRTSVEAGVPLQPSFASAQSVITGEPVQFGDIRLLAEQFSDTASHLAEAGYRACLFLPISQGLEAWGHLGLVRRARQPFDPTGTAYLRAVCSVFALHLQHLSGCAVAALSVP